MKKIENIIDNFIYEQVMSTILNESVNVMEKYHISCEGELIDTFETEEEAKKYLDIYKEKHPKKQFIIEKSKYGSYSEMLDRMDNLNENKKEKKIMEKNKREVRTIAEAVLDAKERGLKEFKIGKNIYNVKKTWQLLAEEEMNQCEECGSGDVMEKKGECYECGTQRGMEESNSFVLAADKARDAGKKEFEYPKGSGKMHKVTIKKNIEVKENKHTCNECGGMLNEEGECNECGVKYESKKIKLRLNENELVSLINKMVLKTMNESVPGLEITNKSRNISGKDSKSHMSDVEKKMKKTLSFDGNDNPEFPKSIGKGDKVAHRTNEKENETIEDYRGGGLEDLDYEYEPSENFKKRMKEALEGSSKMGNSQDVANVIKSKTGEKISKKVDRKKKKEKENFEVSWGHSWKDPEHTISVKESKENSKNSIILNEEMDRMKQMYSYNKKTQ